MWMFDVRKECKRRKVRLVVRSHVIDVSSLPAYYSVVQNLSIRLLLRIAKANNLKIVTGNVGNSRISAKVSESVCSREREEWGDKLGCVLEMLKALCSLKTSARQWLLCLGDTLRDMGFSLSRSDPDI